MSTPARYWVITDLETSGLRPERGHEILQIARKVYDSLERRPVPGSDMMAYIQPEMWNTRDDEALKINKLNLKLLQQRGMHLRNALRRWSADIDWEQSVVAAWGIDFESKFLQASYERLNLSPPYPRHFLDLRTLVYMNTDLSEILGLREAADMFGYGMDRDRQHDAMYDVEKTTEIVNLLT